MVIEQKKTNGTDLFHYMNSKNNKRTFIAQFPLKLLKFSYEIRCIENSFESAIRILIIIRLSIQQENQNKIKNPFTVLRISIRITNIIQSVIYFYTLT